ncbi:hypothetical protein ACFYPQ_40205 [Streptomyces sp. NPDC005522]
MTVLQLVILVQAVVNAQAQDQVDSMQSHRRRAWRLRRARRW